MTGHFQTIGLIGKNNDPSVINPIKNNDSSVVDQTNKLCQYLKQQKRRVLLDKDTAEFLGKTCCEVMNRQELAEACDLVIVLGGDGTLLHAARYLTNTGVPIVGINMGHLGFLADVTPNKMTQQLELILAGNFEEEERTLLHTRVIRDGQVISESEALNETVVHKWDITRMIELDVHIDGHLLNAHRSDGLIVATPTGSTAYALSGGGPILRPTLRAIVMVPICPHSLNNRPIVINDDVEIEIELHNGFHTQAQVTCDGQVNFSLLPGDKVVIRKHDRPLRLIHPQGYDYFEILRRKFNWGHNPSLWSDDN